MKLYSVTIRYIKTAEVVLQLEDDEEYDEVVEDALENLKDDNCVEWRETSIIASDVDRLSWTPTIYEHRGMRSFICRDKLQELMEENE